MDAGCDSVFLGSYSADGAMIVETMAVMGATIPIFSADGMAGSAALADYTNPAVAKRNRGHKAKSRCSRSRRFRSSLCSLTQSARLESSPLKHTTQ